MRLAEKLDWKGPIQISCKFVYGALVTLVIVSQVRQRLYTCELTECLNRS
jgi:hypothetical protein